MRPTPHITSLALLNATGNEMLARMDMLLEPGLRERDRVVHTHDHSADPVPSHQAVFDAVRDQDPARAELAMLDLLAKATRDLDPHYRHRPTRHEAVLRRSTWT